MREFNLSQIGPQGVLWILGEWLFIFRELGSTGNYFRGAWSRLMVLGNWSGALPKIKKNTKIRNNLQFV